MTQNEKDLVFKDLCGRIPYGVKVDVINEDNEHRIVTIGEGNIGHLGKGFWIECKPYLFPLSSMTEEQKDEFNSYVLFDGIQLSWESFDGVMLSDIEVLIDFFHKNHIDYRGLIEKGLANDATGLNIY